MLFSSLTFLFAFLPVVLALNFLAPRSLRNTLLLVASLCFYAWGEGLYLWVMLLSTLINWSLALGLGRSPVESNPRSRYVLVAVGVLANLLILGAFKYSGFVVNVMNDVFRVAGLGLALPLPHLHLPIGISFFTFQAMSYLLDIYRQEKPAERNPLHVGLYIALFPQLVAGPIVRYSDVAAEIHSRTVTLEGFAYGAKRFILGLAKKVLLANTFAVAADQAFAPGAAAPSVTLAWIGLAAFTLQIYFDFSGYSDMAIGLGRMFGFTFLENFNYPYTATSVTEFWRRWHISLSTWFRDYLYRPMGGNRRGPAREYANLATVFLLCGLWHGASWNFVIWGALQGGFLVFERVFLKQHLDRATGPLRLAAQAFTLFCVMIAWVFFRADTLPQALRFFAAMSGISAGPAASLAVWNTKLQVAFAVGALACMPWANVLRSMRRKLPFLASPSAFASVGALFILFVLATMALASGSHNPFIYFRF